MERSRKRKKSSSKEKSTGDSTTLGGNESRTLVTNEAATGEKTSQDSHKVIDLASSSGNGTTSGCNDNPGLTEVVNKSPQGSPCSQIESDSNDFFVPVETNTYTDSAASTDLMPKSKKARHENSREIVKEDERETRIESENQIQMREKKRKKVLAKEKLKEFKDNVEKTGIIYLSRIPPFMKVAKIRHIFEQYGKIGRIYLQQEDVNSRRKRLKFGGNKKKKFVEGWVEFLDKRVAKGVALCLNNAPVGGKKSSYYHDDLWSIKYLPRFKWPHLTERMAYENAVREKKLALEMTQQRRENDFYLSNVDKSKMLNEIIARKQEKDVPLQPAVKRRFRQRRVIGQDDIYGSKSQTTAKKVLNPGQASLE